LGPFRDRAPANRAFRLVGEEVRSTPRTEGRGVIERGVESGQEGQLLGRVSSMADPAGRRVLRHRGAAGLTNARGLVRLLQELIKALREIVLRRRVELDTAEGARSRLRP